MQHDDILRVATYNIHKGEQGIGPARRLEIHNLGLAVEQLDVRPPVLRLHHAPPLVMMISGTAARATATRRPRYATPRALRTRPFTLSPM